MAFIHSCWTDSNNHSPALFMINTGMTRMGFPCLGSWVTYGLGSESQNLPAFVVMYDTLGRGLPKGHAQNWGAGFLPSVYQGTALKPQGDPIDNLNRPAGDERRPAAGPARPAREAQRRNSASRPRPSWPPASRRSSWPIACRWPPPRRSTSTRSRRDAHSSTASTTRSATHFAKQCLIARRLVERGVRFVQIYSGGMENERSWDGHIEHPEQPRRLRAGDRSADRRAARRPRSARPARIDAGHLGRRVRPAADRAEGRSSGRDHNPHAFTVWMAGGGVKGGVHHGATDEIGFKAVEDRVSINDLHATILHLLGLDHKQLTYRYNGRDFRLTDVAGNVVEKIIA